MFYGSTQMSPLNYVSDHISDDIPLQMILLNIVDLQRFSGHFNIYEQDEFHSQFSIEKVL